MLKIDTRVASKYPSIYIYIRWVYNVTLQKIFAQCHILYTLRF